MLVVDASIALTWCFEDEVTAATEAIGAQVDADGAFVPICGGLRSPMPCCWLKRRGRLDRPGVEQRLRLLAALPISIDGETDAHAWNDTMLLARAERLTLYDAAYLELAIRINGTLATLDRALARAARHLGVAVAS